MREYHYKTNQKRWILQDEFKKQEQNLAKIISGNLEITMQEIKISKKENKVLHW